MEQEFKYVEVQEAKAKLLLNDGKPVTMIGTEAIRQSMDPTSFQQINNVANAPDVRKFVVNPDFHTGYGTIVGSVFATKDLIYPCAVGPDVNCSMSFVQLDIPSTELADKALRRAIVEAVEKRIPTGMGSHTALQARSFHREDLRSIATEGANRAIAAIFGFPESWINNCEQATHGKSAELGERLDWIARHYPILDKLTQIGGIGGGNHFMEFSDVRIKESMRDVAEVFGLKNGCVGILNHFGSRGFGYMLTSGGRNNFPGQFNKLAEHFNKWRMSFPGGDKHNVYVPVDSQEGQDYLNDMYMGANFAVVNHLLVCQYVVEAFKEVMGDSLKANFVYHIAHNIIRYEIAEADSKPCPMWVHRKGATRALPEGHHTLKNSPFFSTGHPVLLPGNSIEGSTIMVGLKGSADALNSVNHGAGRKFSRTVAKRSFTQSAVDKHYNEADVITNCRNYPIDEYAKAYKDYSEVIQSVEKAGLAVTVAKLHPLINIKDNDQSKENSA